MTAPAQREAAARPGGGAGPADLLYTQTETELRGAVRALLTDRCAWRDVLARTEAPQTYDTATWHVLAADIGAAGLLIPESSGGAGASYREAAVVAEETGRAVAPVPFLGSAVVATTAALQAGDDDVVAAVASGTTSAVLAVPFCHVPGIRPQPTVRLGPALAGDTGYRLTGTVAGIADALTADVLLVPADGVPYGLFAVRRAEAGVSVVPAVSLDMTRQLADLTLDDVPARRIASGAKAEQAVVAALAAGAAMLASELLGTAEQCLDMTVAYLKERHQFGRPVGSFQALKHRLADLWVAVAQARAAARYAAACLAGDDPDAPVAIALAKACCSDTAVTAAQECVQLHGGIGFTWEHPAHLYLKRAVSASLGFGTADRHRQALAPLVNLPGPQ